jgi:predicted O-methyltransferase YrrM
MKFLSYVRTKIGVVIVNLIRARHGVVIFYGDKARQSDLDFIARVRRERKLLLSDHEAFQIMMTVRRTARIHGDIAEVGAYQGASAKLIAHAAHNKSIHLFDTFEGLPSLLDIDRSAFHDGQFVADVSDVSEYLSFFPSITLYKGIFPETAGPIVSKKFSFVHLDVDLYQSTKDSLEFFYPRMQKGGVIISHDYMTAPGVRKAVDEFMADKPEAVFESSWRQCFIVKG